jgi:hypothetical protein
MHGGISMRGRTTLVVVQEAVAWAKVAGEAIVLGMIALHRMGH